MKLVAALCLLAAPALAEDVTYSADGKAFEGWFSAAEAPKGLVLIVHDWDGLTEYEKRRADMLAELGYDAFALDLFGKGERPETVEGRRAATGALYQDRETMRARLAAGLAQAREMSGAEGVVAIGYCFGGAAALELARAPEAGTLAGVASFHGGLATPEGQSWTAEAPPLLILHGGADEAVPMTELAALSQALEAAGATYEMQVYSGAPHAFTVFGSDRYRERADRESWEAFTGFLADRIGG